MNGAVTDLAEGVIAVAAGFAILLNLEAVAKLDQRHGLKFNTWLKKRLGDSFLTRDIWSVGTRSGMRSSKIGMGFAGVILVVGGLALVAVSLQRLNWVGHLFRMP